MVKGEMIMGIRLKWEYRPGLNWPNIIVAAIGVAFVMVMFECFMYPPIDEVEALLADPNLF